MSLLDRYHPRHIRSQPVGGTGFWDEYVPANKQPQAEYEQLFGYPADIDKVWEARDAAYAQAN